ncbi:DNA-methyltransferase [Spiroplasma corruscae]|uniref:Cytosine-specific methyltransferase n=1 Tax=Spiroplasma corruscae TaxID=216934 RepID=A0A222EQ11_9MOLU|nr:DNA (cytosine-5-)-methyltransferase [Spiroplasma corruscae]ASP28451.1 DNA-methyltransferase [Spiroplasma corruscae]
MKKLKVFEAFAGIGAQNKALSILNKKFNNFFKVVGTSEWDIWSNISYNAIHNNNNNGAKDINESDLDEYLLNFTHSNDGKTPVKSSFILNLPLEIKQLLYTSYRNSNNQGSILELKGEELVKNVGDIDILTYSFPCQDLSVAGSFHGSCNGMKKGSGTRSGLLWEIERILKELKIINKLPKYLLLENVKNMISSKHKTDYIEWINFLKSIGYNTQTYLLNSYDHGIPQKRERVYAISCLKSINNFSDTWTEKKRIIESNKIDNFNDIIKNIHTLEEVLKVDYSKKKYENEAIFATPNNTPSRVKMFEENPVLYTQEIWNYPIFIKNNIGFYNSTSEGLYLKSCRTITTKQDRHPNAGIIDLRGSSLSNINKKSKYRFLTPRETYLLMGFDESDFEKAQANNIKQAVLYRQSGNSITVNVLISIFKKIYDLEINNEGENNDK